MCICTVTSSAVVGSSAISTEGSHSRLMPIITRWRNPPDSSCGYCRRRRRGSEIRTRSRIRRALCSASRHVTCRWRTSTSASCVPMRKCGVSAVIGS